MLKMKFYYKIYNKIEVRLSTGFINHTMEFYEQGKLMFAQAKKTGTILSGTSLDFYIASADAFAKAHDELVNENPEVSERAVQLAYHLYRHCSINAPKDSDIHRKAIEQLRTFLF